MAAKAEDAAELRLGEEFDHETCLSNAEVAILLTEAKAKYEAEDRAVPEVFDQTLAYCARFSQIKDPVGNMALVEELRTELEQLSWERYDDGERKEVKLHQFELVAAINLKMDEVDEAAALVPSLHQRLAEGQLEEVLDKINRATGRTFQS